MTAADGPQWGVVIEGTIELTIGRETKIYKTGDAYFIPDGVVYSARWKPGLKTIDFFSDKDRYQTKAKPKEGAHAGAPLHRRSVKRYG